MKTITAYLADVLSNERIQNNRSLKAGYFSSDESGFISFCEEKRDKCNPTSFAEFFKTIEELGDPDELNNCYGFIWFKDNSWMEYDYNTEFGFRFHVSSIPQIPDWIYER